MRLIIQKKQYIPVIRIEMNNESNLALNSLLIALCLSESKDTSF